ncbi:MAG: ShlB/FhaC/HecB family hemolysin secretion/activation protein [Caulobacter sp.]|nr:ShlB/FhaC/HecB family hemolysin secretion/activation protein [Caulobacter sp.]
MRSAAILIALLGTPAFAWGQDFKRVIPIPLAPAAPPTFPAPPPAPPPTSDPTVLAPALNGLVFVPGLASFEPRGVRPDYVASGVVTTGLPLLSTPAFKAKISPFVGRPLTRSDLEQITAIARQTYVDAERPFLEVSVPEQNVQNGIVQIVVTEYRLGEVKVSGAKHFSDEVIRRLGNLRPGETLTLPRMRRALDDFNQNPFLSVDAVVQPGAATGVSDVVVEAKDRRPFRAYAGYDNQGVPNLGRDEWNVGFNAGDLFGQGNIFSYQYTRSVSGRYTSHSFSDVQPIRGGARLLLFGAYATQKPEIGFGFGSEGHSAQLSGRFSTRLPDYRRLSQTLQVGVDYKSTDNNLDFSGFRLLRTEVAVFQIPIVYSLSVPDKWGRTDIENQAVFSPGDVVSHNGDQDMRRLVPGSEANYVYDRLTVTRTTFLPKGASWIVRGLGQVASDNLPYSEQIGAGGLGSVRGYDSNTLLGSKGFVLSTELRAPPWEVLRRLKKNSPVRDSLQLGVFWDYADLDQVTPFPDLIASGAQLQSIGFNVHYKVADAFSVQLEVGHQLRAAPWADEQDTRAAVVVSIAY